MCCGQGTRVRVNQGIDGFWFQLIYFSYSTAAPVFLIYWVSCLSLCGIREVCHEKIDLCRCHKLVSYQKKDGRAWPHSSFFWYDPDLFVDSADIIDYILEKSVSCQYHAWPRAPMLMSVLSWFASYVYSQYEAVIMIGPTMQNYPTFFFFCKIL